MDNKKKTDFAYDIGYRHGDRSYGTFKMEEV